MRIRLKFIEAMLLTGQRLTRQIVADRFEVSLPTATRSMREYKQRADVSSVGRGAECTYVLGGDPIFHWECPKIFLKHLEKVYERTDKSISDCT